MNTPYVRWILTSFAFSLCASAQDPAPLDLEALRKDLLAKFDGLGPLSAKLLFESVDAKGTKSLKGTTEVHLRLAECWMYAVMKEMEEDKPPIEGFMLYEGDGPMLAWRPGHGAYRMDYSLYYRTMWQGGWEAGRERNRVLGDPETFRTHEEFAASLQPHFKAQMDPDPSGAPKAGIRLTMGKAINGGASWLALGWNLSKAEFAAGQDTVTVRETVPKRTTVIDRKTGFLRSIRIDFPNGEARLTTVTEFARGTPKPEIRRPEKWKDRKIPGETAASALARDVAASAKKTLEMVLERWDRAKAPDRADAIHGYFAWYAGMQEALYREGSRAQWASDYLKSVVEGGAKLEDLVRDMDNWADKFGVFVQWGEKTHAEKYTQYVDKIQKELLKSLAELPGSDEAKRALVPLIKEGFAPERVEKARPKRPAPDYKHLLREAIEDARPKD